MSTPSLNERYANVVEQELATGNQREPVWQEALSAAGGDEQAGRERYLQLRVDQMLADEAERQAVHQARRKQRRFLDSFALTTAQKNVLLGSGIIIMLLVAVCLLLRK